MSKAKLVKERGIRPEITSARPHAVSRENRHKRAEKNQDLRTLSGRLPNQESHWHKERQPNQTNFDSTQAWQDCEPFVRRLSRHQPEGECRQKEEEKVAHRLRHVFDRCITEVSQQTGNSGYLSFEPEVNQRSVAENQG